MNFKCLVPLFSTTLSTKMSNFITGMHSLANKAFLSIYSPEHKGGMIMKANECAIEYTRKTLNTEPFTNACEDSLKVIDMVDNNGNTILLLEPKEIVNDTTNIFGEMYDVAGSSGSYSTVSLNNIVEFLGLENCSAESVIESLQQWITSQMPITRLPNTDCTDKDNNWLMQEVDILGAKVPVWSILATVVTAVGVASVGIGYCVGKSQKQGLANKNVNPEIVQESMQNTSLYEEQNSVKERMSLVKDYLAPSLDCVTPNTSLSSSEYSIPLDNMTSNYSEPSNSTGLYAVVEVVDKEHVVNIIGEEH